MSLASEPSAEMIEAHGASAAAGAPRWWARLRRDRGARWSAGALALLLAIVTAGPWISPYGEASQDLTNNFAAPSAAHWLGTDNLGRDLLTRILFGGRISMAVGVFGALFAVVIGVAVGGVAGLAGGMTERLIMRFIDFLYGVPLLLVVIALRVVMGQQIESTSSFHDLSEVFIALGLVYWLGMARLVRVRVAELRSREFVDAARVLGAGPARILVRHILPNVTGIIVVTGTFLVPEAIFTESFLSFLGLGVRLPHASWGSLASDGLAAMNSHPHLLAAPAVAICLTMFLFQTLGEALRNALDPRQSEGD